MSKLIGCVKEKFEFSEPRRLIVALDTRFEQLAPDVILRIGDAIELRGISNTFQTKIAGIEIADPWTPERLIAFMLPSEVESEQIQFGMSVWKLY